MAYSENQSISVFMVTWIICAIIGLVIDQPGLIIIGFGISLFMMYVIDLIVNNP